MIVHLWKDLAELPAIDPLLGVTLRTYAGEEDIAGWLELRARAFAEQKPAVRSWTRADFAAEFLAKSWWMPERMWFAEAAGAIGSVTWAMRGRPPDELPVIHWLMVAPEWRLRGVGGLLIRTLEAACWQAGYRKIGLETHRDWLATNGFYRAMGYVGRGGVQGPSPFNSMNQQDLPIS